MPRDLFGDVTHPSVSVGSRKWYVVPLSLAAHISVVVAIVFASLVAHEFLPLPRELMTFVSAEPLPPTPPAPVRPVTPKRPDVNPNAAPLVTPDAITPDSGFEPMPSTELGAGVDVVVPGGGIVVGEPPPPPPAPQAQEPIRVGGRIKMPAKIKDAAPIYPPIAQAARVQGTVILEAVIGVDGRVQNVRVLRSIPLLDQAAIDAVRQWEYSATLLNGVPVPVVMTVTVTFTLNR
jgi:protein TonB